MDREAFHEGNRSDSTGSTDQQEHLAYPSNNGHSNGKNRHADVNDMSDAYVRKEDPDMDAYRDADHVDNLDAFQPGAESGRHGQPNCVRRLLSRVMPSGGFLAGVFNLAGSSLGAGILGLPNAMHTSGVVMGTIYLIVIFLLTVYSMRLLAIVTLKTGIQSYEGTARGLFGRGGDIFTAIVMFVKCFGACIAYVICVSDLWSAFLKDDRVGGYYRTLSFRRVLTSVTFIVLMLPLSLPKHINSLRYVSLIGVSFIVFFCFCVIAHSAVTGLEGLKDGEMVMFRTGNTAIKGLGQFMFAYLCQSNAYELSREMKPRLTVRKMEIECFFGMVICTLLYWLTGFFGYADFGDGIASSLLTVYSPLKDYYFAVAYVGIVVKLCVAFALHILPCRDSVHHVIGWNLETVAWWKNAVLCTILSGLSLVCGLFIPNVNMVFGLLGSLTGGFIAFVFPSLFMMYAGGFTLKKVGFYDFFGTCFLLLCGVVVICFGTTSTIHGIVLDYS